jgi:hypothetical protein
VDYPLDPELAEGWNVIVHLRIFIEEPMAIAKDLHNSDNINRKEECSCYAQRRKSSRID